jgi:membrane-associated protease RseP (regulator of RpoE activity)
VASMWRVVVAVVGLTVSGWVTAQGDEPAAAATAEQITGWIEQLGAAEFARREAATKSLLAAGRPAVEPLAAAVQAGDLEVASRGIEILRGMLAADPPLAVAAAAALEACAEGARPAAARLAEAAIDFHQLGQAVAARERLEALGAVFVDPPLADREGAKVEFGGGWKGGGDDLANLTRLPRLKSVAFHGVPVDDSGLAVLRRLAGISRIELFGTGLTEDAVTALAARLPDTVIDVRRGGKLGVGALAFGRPCEIQSVEPGSAADQAGVRPGDVVVAIDGAAVTDFAGLTARVAGRIPGDTIRLAVDRRGGDPGGDAERLEFEIRLDAW